MMKIQHTNHWINPLLDVYLEELRMIVFVLNNSILNHDLSSSFAIPLQRLSFVASTAVYNKIMKFVTLELMSNKTKKLTKNQVA